MWVVVVKVKVGLEEDWRDEKGDHMNRGWFKFHRIFTSKVVTYVRQKFILRVTGEKRQIWNLANLISDRKKDVKTNKFWLQIYIGSDPRTHYLNPYVLKPILLTIKYLTHSLKPLDRK